MFHRLRPRLFPLLIVVGLLLAAFVPVASASGSYLFYGTVYRDSGWRPTGVIVRAFREGDGYDLASIATGTNGHFELYVPVDSQEQVTLAVEESYYTDMEHTLVGEAYAGLHTIMPGGYKYVSPNMEIVSSLTRIPFEVTVLLNTDEVLTGVAGMHVEFRAQEPLGSPQNYDIGDMGQTGLNGSLPTDEWWIPTEDMERDIWTCQIFVSGYMRPNDPSSYIEYMRESKAFRYPQTLIPVPIYSGLAITGREWEGEWLVASSGYVWDQQDEFFEAHHFLEIEGQVNTTYTGGPQLGVEEVWLAFITPNTGGQDWVGSALTKEDGSFWTMLIDPDLSQNIEIVLFAESNTARPVLGGLAYIDYVVDPYSGQPHHLSSAIWLEMGDMNRDKTIDMLDMDLVAACYDCHQFDEPDCWWGEIGDPSCKYLDIDDDYWIDIVELTCVGANYGKSFDDVWQVVTAMGQST